MYFASGQILTLLKGNLLDSVLEQNLEEVA